MRVRSTLPRFRLKHVFPILALTLGAGLAPLQAASLSVQVSDSAGQKLADAVIFLTAESAEPSPAKPVSREHFVDQKDETFLPLVEVMAAGDQVIFRNSDRTRHHVYSFSPLGSFEFVLKPGESSTPVTLQKAGIIAVGCNIHDFMLSYLVVNDKGYAGKSDASGLISLGDLPPGKYSARYWHPRLRPGAAQPTQSITIAGEQANTAITLPVLPERKDDPDKDHY